MVRRIKKPAGTRIPAGSARTIWPVAQSRILIQIARSPWVGLGHVLGARPKTPVRFHHKRNERLKSIANLFRDRKGISLDPVLSLSVDIFVCFVHFVVHRLGELMVEVPQPLGRKSGWHCWSQSARSYGCIHTSADLFLLCCRHKLE
jgi:hypothetical protein